MPRRALQQKGKTSKLTSGMVEDLIMGRGWSMEALLERRPDFESEEQRREVWQRFGDRVRIEMLRHTGDKPQRNPAAVYDYESFDPADLVADKLYLRRDEPGPGLPYGEGALP